jgi:hypothetical protein
MQDDQLGAVGQDFQVRAGTDFAESVRKPDPAWYTREHIPMLLAVPGWRRIRRFRLTGGTAPAYLSLHEVAGTEVFDEDGYRAAVTTPWRNRIVDAAIGRERRVFGFHRPFG